MLETHPFGSFVPPHARFFILGSFTGKPEAGYNWFYTSKRNQFWPILEEVYGLELDSKKTKQELFSKLKIAISDIIYQCERKKGTNLDNNLTNIVYNIPAVEKILTRHKIEKIFFSSRFVKNKFKKVFKDLVEKYPNIKLITLPSPSPRYAAMTRKEKIKRYRNLLPRLS